MIRPEFRKILLDQRGAAVILWSFFFISVPIYLVIARHLLGNPNLGTNPAIAAPTATPTKPSSEMGVSRIRS